MWCGSSDSGRSPCKLCSEWTQANKTSQHNNAIAYDSCIIIPRCDDYVTVYPTAKHVYTVVLVFCYCLR